MQENRLDNASNRTSPQWNLKGTLCISFYYYFVDAFHVDAGLTPIRLTTNFSSDDMWFEGPGGYFTLKKDLQAARCSDGSNPGASIPESNEILS